MEKYENLKLVNENQVCFWYTAVLAGKACHIRVFRRGNRDEGLMEAKVLGMKLENVVALIDVIKKPSDNDRLLLHMAELPSLIIVKESIGMNLEEFLMCHSKNLTCYDIWRIAKDLIHGIKQLKSVGRKICDLCPRNVQVKSLALGQFQHILKVSIAEFASVTITTDHDDDDYDLWSVGLILLEAVCSRLIIEPGENTRIKVLSAVFRIFGVPDNPSDWNYITNRIFICCLNKEFLDLLKGLLDYDPTKRIKPADAIEIIDKNLAF